MLPTITKKSAASQKALLLVGVFLVVVFCVHMSGVLPNSSYEHQVQVRSGGNSVDDDINVKLVGQPVEGLATNSGTSSMTTTKPTTTVPELLRALDTARDAYFEKLKVDYGEEHYESMFFTTNANDGQRVTRGRTIMQSPSGGHGVGVSFDRLQRKFVKKILQAQTTGATIPLVWMTGGHSSA
jgi:hypothetical protein